MVIIDSCHDPIHGIIIFTDQMTLEFEQAPTWTFVSDECQAMDVLDIRVSYVSGDCAPETQDVQFTIEIKLVLYIPRFTLTIDILVFSASQANPESF